MISVIILTFYDHRIAVDLDLLRIADYRDPKMLGDLRSNLCGISIDRLTAGDDQIVIQVS